MSPVFGLANPQYKKKDSLQKRKKKSIFGLANNEIFFIIKFSRSLFFGLVT
jgi:hypothetical protein